MLKIIFHNVMIAFIKKNVIIRRMKKVILIITMFCIVMTGSVAMELDNVQLPMRDYDKIELKTGTFIPVMNAQDISTEYCPQGYKVKFIVSNDMFLHETNIIPRGSEFYGYIEQIHEPVVGTHASMKIKIVKLVLADKFEVPVKGYIYNSNGNLIGGGITEPAEYIKVPHWQQKFQGKFWTRRGPTLQIRPGPTRKQGEHTRINAGEEMIVILTAPAWITHTLTN